MLWYLNQHFLLKGKFLLNIINTLKGRLLVGDHNERIKLESTWLKIDTHLQPWNINVATITIGYILYPVCISSPSLFLPPNLPVQCSCPLAVPCPYLSTITVPSPFIPPSAQGTFILWHKETETTKLHITLLHCTVLDLTVLYCNSLNFTTLNLTVNC